MRFTPTRLALKYANHIGEFQAAVMGIVVGLMFSLPWCACIGTQLMPLSPILASVSYLVLFAPAAWFTVRGIREIRQRIWLVCRGQPVLGIIIKVEIRKHKSSRWIESLTYTYRVKREGQDSDRVIVESRSPLYRPGEIQSGDVVLVMYEAENPRRSEIDRFDARRADRLRLFAEDPSDR